jgi:hypothetical protein
MVRRKKESLQCHSFACCNSFSLEEYWLDLSILPQATEDICCTLWRRMHFLKNVRLSCAFVDSHSTIYCEVEVAREKIENSRSYF